MQPPTETELLEDALTGPQSSNMGTLIADEARSHIGSTTWAKDSQKGEMGPAGVWKCNLFVYDVLNATGTAPPLEWRLSLSDFPYTHHPPLAKQWANPDHEIPGWVVVTDPQPGDVVAIAMDYDDASGHVGIVTGPGATTSATKSSVIENNWGFRPTQKPVFRRYVGQ